MDDHDLINMPVVDALLVIADNPLEVKVRYLPTNAEIEFLRNMLEMSFNG